MYKYHKMKGKIIMNKINKFWKTSLADIEQSSKSLKKGKGEIICQEQLPRRY